jgi:uncharacterized MAPEG superfamily protein
MMTPQTPTELKLLGAAVLIGLIQVFCGATAATRERGFAWNAGPRDEPRPNGVLTGRFDRALRNFLETFPLFAALILACAVAGKLGGALTIWGSWLYVVARAIYVPVYAAGVPYLRTLVWAVGLAGLLMVLAALFS